MCMHTLNRSHAPTRIPLHTHIHTHSKRQEAEEAAEAAAVAAAAAAKKKLAQDLAAQLEEKQRARARAQQQQAEELQRVQQAIKVDVCMWGVVPWSYPWVSVGVDLGHMRISMCRCTQFVFFPHTASPSHTTPQSDQQAQQKQRAQRQAAKQALLVSLQEQVRAGKKAQEPGMTETEARLNASLLSAVAKYQQEGVLPSGRVVLL